MNPPRYICSRPFKWFEITPSGDVYACCPTWLPKPIGNILQQSVNEIWNSKRAQTIRRSMLDGTFRYCNKLLCPNLQLLTSSVQKVTDVRDKDVRFAIDHNATTLPYGPRTINCGFDRSCNLSCPTCRLNTIIATGKDKERVWKIIDTVEREAARDLHELYITGSGDPFGSPHFFTWLRRMKLKDFPSLKTIHLHTNGQLFTPKTWQMMSNINNFIRSVEISIDAATPETYAVNRRGGNFKRLTENLAFIQKLRSSGKLRFVCISFVIQANNFREVPMFIRMRERFNFDVAYFSQLVNWGTFTEKEYLARAVHLPEHPQHKEFRTIMDAVDIHPTKMPGNRTNIPTFIHQTERKQYTNYISQRNAQQSTGFLWMKKIESLAKAVHSDKG